jgi:Fe-S-cluster containining protein
MPKYDCSKCPGYCCSYPNIRLTKPDVARLAKHFGVTFEEAERKFTRERYGEKWTLKRKKDENFGRICRFFDSKKRNCGIYEARPEICRTFPNESRCGYYDFLTFERKHQEDQSFVAKTNSEEWQ